MFGNAMGSNRVTRDGVGQVLTDFTALRVSDPTTFGMWRLDNPEETVYNAIRAGYRRFDSACDYGNEEQTGSGIRRALDEGIVKREDLYITTKLWNTYHAQEHVPLALDRCLTDLGLDYVDEFLIHFPISMEFVPFEKKYPPEWTNLDGEMVLVKNDINATWKAMEMLVDTGKTRHIGLSNFTCQHIRQVLSIARIRPTSLQVECHPHLSQTKLIRFARESGIRVSAFSAMGGTSYISLGMATQTDLLFEHPLIVSISKNYKKTAAQVLLRWAIQRNTLPINKSSSLERMKENRGLFDFYLSKEDMLAIDGLNKNRRYNDPGDFCEPGMGTFCPIYE
jgi:diketogulonate reductase-like aldo/keto reductase